MKGSDRFKGIPAHRAPLGPCSPLPAGEGPGARARSDGAWSSALTPALSRRARRPRRQGGTIMFEILLVLPFLILVFLLMIYFGHAVTRMHTSWTIDRYTAWQHVEQAPAPGQNTALRTQEVGELFARPGRQGLSFSSADRYPLLARDLFERAAGALGGVETEQLVRTAHEQFPHGYTARYVSRYNEWLSFEQRLGDTAIRHEHTRIGNDWKFANGWRLRDGQWEHGGSGPWMLPQARRTFYQWFHEDLEALGSQTPMAGMLRRLYEYRPSYRGPEVGF